MSDAPPPPEPRAGMGGPSSGDGATEDGRLAAGSRVADGPGPSGPPVGPGGPPPRGNGRFEGPPPGGPPPGRKSRTRRTIVEWVAVLVVAVLAALLLRSFVIQPYYIPSGSMEPTLRIGDKVLVDKLSYHMHSVHRGDVIVFKRPPYYNAPGVKDLIKRVIGLPGETISGCDNGQVCINGRLLKEPWLPKKYAYTGYFAPVHIPADHYFVMGDHRSDSDDSRFALGPISGKLIVGRAFLIVWPLGHITGL